MCTGMSKTQKGNVAAIHSFSDTMVAQASQVFGNDNAVFNNIKSAYESIVNAGPSQQGFSQAERNALNAAVVTNDAQAARIASATAGMQASAFGGGNEALDSGALNSRNANIAFQSAEQTAKDLNEVQQRDYEAGRENFFAAARGEAQLPSIYNNMSGFDENTGKALDDTYQKQAYRDAAGGGWKKAVMNLGVMGLNLIPGVGPALSAGAGAALGMQGSDPTSAGAGLAGIFKKGSGGGGGAAPDFSDFVPTGGGSPTSGAGA